MSDLSGSFDRLLTRRALLLGGLQAAGLLLLGGRLVHLQITDASKYQTLAEDNRISTRLLAPPRGRIFDRNGILLAGNEQNFQAILVPEQADDPNATIAAFMQQLPLTPEHRARIERELARQRGFEPILIHDNLTWEQVALLELHSAAMPGISIEAGTMRTYPYAEATAHMVGHVGAVSEAEQTGDPLLAVPGLRIGKMGVERFYDNSLRGTAGYRQLEVNAHGRVVRTLGQEPGQAGPDLRLTLDIGLQDYIQNLLRREKAASAVVMDPFNGALYAAVSYPSFDPNLFTFGISPTAWEELQNNIAHPMVNKALGGQYAPGSTFKMLVALAGLDAGLLDPKATVNCPGYYELGDHRFHCHKHSGHGKVDMHDAIKMSCDVYFYDLSRRLGIDRIMAMSRRFGLGEKPSVDLPNARSGFIPSRAWKQAARGEPWLQGETLISSIGQGYTLATPLQLAIMTARLINGGRAVQPHLNRAADTQLAPSMNLKSAHLALIKSAMDDVANDKRGSAFAHRIKEKGFEMGGKTGTSQVRRISMKERASGIIANEDREWRQRDHALFVGYAPLTNPRYVVSVIVEHGGSGGKIAAPLARDILLETQKRNPANN